MTTTDFLKVIQKQAESTEAQEKERRRAEMLFRCREPAVCPEVGIWWAFQGRVFRVAVPYQTAPIEDSLQMIADEHVHAWPPMREIIAETLSEVIDLRYNDPERGRVWFHTSSKKFIITCSRAVITNYELLAEAKRQFGLTTTHRLTAVNDPQYDVLPAGKFSR